MSGLRPDDELIAAAVGSLVGLHARNATIGVGSFVTADFGGTRLTSTGDLQGEFYLWIYGGAWTVVQDDVVRATSEDDRSAMQSAVSTFEGAVVVGVVFGVGTVGLRLDFDTSVSLVVTCGDPEMADWMLFLPDGFVVVAGPGDGVRLTRADEPDSWS